MTTNTNTTNKKRLTIREVSERLAFLEQVYGTEYNMFDLPEAAKAFIQGEEAADGGFAPPLRTYDVGTGTYINVYTYQALERRVQEGGAQ